MIKTGTLSNGFEYSINDEVLDDMELIDAMEQSQGDDPLKVGKVIAMILGDDQKSAFYDSIRNESGRVPVNETVTLLTELIESLGDQGKN
jgi:hypothetical protein